MLTTILNKINSFSLWLKHSKFKRNLGIFILNIVIFLILILKFNLTGLSETAYESASKLTPWNEKDISKIIITNPLFKKNNIKEIELLRKNELSFVKEDKKNFSIKDIFSKKTKHFNWALNLISLKNSSVSEAVILNTVAKDIELEADNEKVSEFFESLQNLRSYYAIPRTVEKEKSSGIYIDNNGIQSGIIIEFLFSNGRKEFLYVGEAVKKANENFVRLNNDNEIFLVKANLVAKSGRGDENYFRSNRFWSKEIDITGINSISFITKKTNKNFLSLSKIENDWTMPFPITTSKLKKEAIQNLIKDILNWKVTQFHNKIPNDLDSKFSPFEINIRYLTKDNQEFNYTLDVIGKKGANNYVCVLPDYSIREFTSSILEQTIDPIKFFTEPTLPKK